MDGQLLVLVHTVDSVTAVRNPEPSVYLRSMLQRAKAWCFSHKKTSLRSLLVFLTFQAVAFAIVAFLLFTGFLLAIILPGTFEAEEARD